MNENLNIGRHLASSENRGVARWTMSSWTMQIEPAWGGGTTTLCSKSEGAIAGRISAWP